MRVLVQLVQNTIIVNTRAPFDIHVTRLNISLKQRTSPGMWKSFNLSWWIDSTSKRGEYRRDRFHVKSLTQLPRSPPLRRERQRGRELFLLNTTLTENFSRMQISRFRSTYRKNILSSSTGEEIRFHAESPSLISYPRPCKRVASNVFRTLGMYGRL